MYLWFLLWFLLFQIGQIIGVPNIICSATTSNAPSTSVWQNSMSKTQHGKNAYSLAKVIILQPGERVKIPTKSLEKTWLSQGKIISIIDEGRFLNIQARKTGKLFLSVGSKLYNIQVLPANTKHHFKLLQSFVKTRWGLKVKVLFNKNFQIHIAGLLLRVKDFKSLIQFAFKHNIAFFFSAKVPIDIRKSLHTFLAKQVPILHQSKLRHNNTTQFLNIDWNDKPLSITLAKSHPYFKAYTEHFKHYGLLTKQDSSLLPLPPTVELTLLLVETGSHFSLNNHFLWGEEKNNTSLSSENNFITQLFSRSFQKGLSFFKAMENKGTAHILAQAVLLNEHNQKAHFHSGGEVPIPSYHPKTGATGIKWKSYGVRLTFTTKVGRQKNIHIKTSINISDVNHIQSAHSAPKIQSHSFNSSITMQSGQTLALSTLIRKQGGNNKQAPWLINKLPLVNNFLSHSGNIKAQTKLNIFITAKKVHL